MLFLISSKCRPITFKESPPSSKKSESIEINLESIFSTFDQILIIFLLYRFKLILSKLVYLLNLTFRL